MPYKQKILPVKREEEVAYLNAMGCHKLLLGQVRSAIRDFKRVDRLAGENTQVAADALFERAQAYFVLGELRVVMSLMQRALEITPARSALHYLKGLAEVSYKKSYPLLSQGISSLKKAKELDKESGSGIAWDLALALYQLGELTGEAVEYAQAIDLLEGISSLYSDNSRFLLDFFEVRMALGKKMKAEPLMQAALEQIKQVRRLEPDRSVDNPLARVYKRLFEITSKMTYFNLSNTHFSAVALSEPSAKTFLGWADLLRAAAICRRDPIFLSVGLKKYERALELNPDSLEYALAYVTAIAYYALISETIDELPKAAELLASFQEREGRMEPAFQSEFAYAKALCQTALGFFHSSPEFFQQAMPLFSDAIAKRPCHGLYWHGAGICMLGLSYQLGFEGHIEKAIHCFEKASQFDASFDYAIDEAFACLRSAQLDGSRVMLDRSIHLFESTLAKSGERKNEWVFHYGCALRFKGELLQSSALLSDALSLLTSLEMDELFSPAAHLEMGLAHAIIGEIEGSRSNLKQALSHFEIVMRGDIENERAFCESAMAEINLAHLSDGGNAPFYKRAEARLIHAARLGSLQALYYLGCLYSLNYLPEKAIAYLQKAKNYDALPPLEQMKSDPWLDNIREEDRFKRLIQE